MIRARPGSWHRSLMSVSRLLALTLLVGAAGGCSSDPATVVSHIDDDQIKESSSLAVSRAYPDLAYTMNDSGYDPDWIYAVKISTGEVLGRSQIQGAKLHDTEALALDGNGMLWVADLGDNNQERGDCALYALPEPGPAAGDHVVSAQRYPISYPAGPLDVETLLVNPVTGEKFVASKVNDTPGEFYSLPATLSTTSANRASDIDRQAPVKATDGAFSPDGKLALVRTGDKVYVYDGSSFAQTDRLSLPDMDQGESISFEPSGRTFLVGSEGGNSPLFRVDFAQ